MPFRVSDAEPLPLIAIPNIPSHRIRPCTVRNGQLSQGFHHRSRGGLSNFFTWPVTFHPKVVSPSKSEIQPSAISFGVSVLGLGCTFSCAGSDPAPASRTVRDRRRVRMSGVLLKVSRVSVRALSVTVVSNSRRVPLFTPKGLNPKAQGCVLTLGRQSPFPSYYPEGVEYERPRFTPSG